MTLAVEESITDESPVVVLVSEAVFVAEAEEVLVAVADALDVVVALAVAVVVALALAVALAVAEELLVAVVVAVADALAVSVVLSVSELVLEFVGSDVIDELVVGVCVGDIVDEGVGLLDFVPDGVIDEVAVHDWLLVDDGLTVIVVELETVPEGVKVGVKDALGVIEQEPATDIPASEQASKQGHGIGVLIPLIGQ